MGLRGSQAFTEISAGPALLIMLVAKAGQNQFSLNLNQSTLGTNQQPKQSFGLGLTSTGMALGQPASTAQAKAFNYDSVFVNKEIINHISGRTKICQSYQEAP